jgi:hypothetical protein
MVAPVVMTAVVVRAVLAPGCALGFVSGFVFLLVPVLVAERTRLRLERRATSLHGEPEPAHHVVEYVVVLVGEPAVAELYGHVPVAEVVRPTKEQMRVGGVRDRKVLRRRAHDDHLATVGQEQLSVA